MKQCSYETPYGTIVYWINDINPERCSLVFLPGLTADHRLFDKQIAYFKDRYNVFVWDAPGHAASFPFELSFSLADKVKWLDRILFSEGIADPVIIGQSMGGYLGQMYAELFPAKLKGFVSIDSAPLQMHYMTKIEIWMLKHTEGMYRAYPWKRLVKDGANGCAETTEGRKIMRNIMMEYDGDHERYVKLVSHGYGILAEAIEANLPYEIKCPAILICGEKDKAGSTKRYNRKWAKETELPIYWIPNAGHNSNTDAPEKVNAIIEKFIFRIQTK